MEHLLHVMQKGTVSTNIYLRRMHNFAFDMNWLPASIIPKRQWPPIRFKEKRAITLEEHQRIIAAEVNPKRKAFYQLCWHLGGSQGDIALLKGEDVDWTKRTVSFFRKKTDVPVLLHLGKEALNLFKDLPAQFPRRHVEAITRTLRMSGTRRISARIRTGAPLKTVGSLP